MPVTALPNCFSSDACAPANATLRQVDSRQHKPARDAVRSIALAIERARLRCLVACAASSVNCLIDSISHAHQHLDPTHRRGRHHDFPGRYAITDITRYRIPNIIVYAIVAAFVVGAAFNLSWPALGWSVLAGVGMFLLGAGLFALGLFGGGDVKLVAAMALWTGIAAACRVSSWS